MLRTTEFELAKSGEHDDSLRGAAQVVEALGWWLAQDPPGDPGVLYRFAAGLRGKINPKPKTTNERRSQVGRQADSVCMYVQRVVRSVASLDDMASGECRRKLAYSIESARKIYGAYEALPGPDESTQRIALWMPALRRAVIDCQDEGIESPGGSSARVTELILKRCAAAGGFSRPKRLFERRRKAVERVRAKKATR